MEPRTNQLTNNNQKRRVRKTSGPLLRIWKLLWNNSTESLGNNYPSSSFEGIDLWLMIPLGLILKNGHHPLTSINSLRSMRNPFPLSDWSTPLGNRRVPPFYPLSIGALTEPLMVLVIIVKDEWRRPAAEGFQFIPSRIMEFDWKSGNWVSIRWRGAEEVNFLHVHDLIHSLLQFTSNNTISGSRSNLFIRGGNVFLMSIYRANKSVTLPDIDKWFACTSTHLNKWGQNGGGGSDGVNLIHGGKEVISSCSMFPGKLQRLQLILMAFLQIA